MKNYYMKYLPDVKTTLLLAFIFVLNANDVFSYAILSNRSEKLEMNTGKDKFARIDSAALRINDTTAASFDGLDTAYCYDNTTSFPITFTPPAPAPASSRIFIRLDGNGITPTGQYTADFTPSTKGKYKINYIVRDSISVQQPVYVWSPIVLDVKGNIVSGCDCDSLVGYATVRQLGPEKVGYSSADVTVGIGSFSLPASKCISDAAIDLTNFADPSYSTGQTGTGFSIVSATATYPAGILSGTIFDPSMISSSTTFTIQYKYVSILGCADSSTSSITVTKPPPQPSYTGLSPGSYVPCEGVAINYNINRVSDATSYTWQLPTGWAGSSSTTGISATPSGTAGNITVTAVNSCGNSLPTNLAVIPNAIPDPPISISGSTNPCQGSTTGYTTAAVPRANTYNWTLPTGWTGSSTTNSITATPNSTANNIILTASNACGVSTATTLAVTPNSTPNTPGSISGLTTLTQNTTDNPFSVTAVARAASYNWSYTGIGYTIINGSTNSIGIDFSNTGSSGTLSVTATNACGTSSSNSVSVTVNPSVVNQPAAFTTSTSAICEGQSSVVYTVPNDPSVTYQWSYTGTGATINGTSNSITIDYPASSTSGTLSVIATIASVSSTPRSLVILVNTTPVISTSIVGSLLPYEGVTTTYSIASVTGATSYTWTLPGWVGNSSTNSISVIPDATAGDVTVSATNYCGTSNVATLSNVTPGKKPSNPGSITGPTGSVHQGTAGNVYSITAIPAATSYTWSYSGTGATINGNGASITVDFSNNATAGVLSVIANNVHGSSSPSNLLVTPQPQPLVTGVFDYTEHKPSFYAYPNPYSDVCSIKVSFYYSTPISLRVTDVYGISKDIVTNQLIEAGDNEFIVPELASGIYLLTLYLEDKAYTTRVIRTR